MILLMQPISRLKSLDLPHRMQTAFVSGAITYTDDMMAKHRLCSESDTRDAGGKYKSSIEALQTCLDVVNQNRQELAPQTAQAAAITGTYHDSEPIPEEDELLDDLEEN